MANQKSKKLTKEQVDHFEMIQPMLEKIFEEVKELSKKKQDGVLNLVKVKMINRILSKVKIIVADEPTNEFLELLDEESLPSNSDAVLIMAQFLEALDQYQSKHKVRRGYEDFWDI